MEKLLSVQQATQRLWGAFVPVETTLVPLAEAAGRVLAEEIHAPLDLPPFDNSSMDGFAVRAAEVREASPEHPVVLHVVADIPAGGGEKLELQAGQAIRIMTGAPLPDGADAVVPVEDTDQGIRQAGTALPAQVAIYRPAPPAANVRPRGQDVRSGELVLPACLPLRPQDVGLLAMLGLPEVCVYRRVRVALLSTGDELLPVGTPLRPGAIYNSNGYTLSALLAAAGAEVVDLGIARDSLASVCERLDLAAAYPVDLILSSAGVSVGAFDFVRAAVEAHGRLDFWRVNMRPGKPLAFGFYGSTPLIGLPGNPVSAFVGFEVFVRPVLARLSGLEAVPRWVQPVELAEAIESDGRESYLRASVHFEEGRWLARLAGHQGSGNLRSLVQANALIILPSEVKSLPIGARISAWLLDNAGAARQNAPGKLK